MTSLTLNDYKILYEKADRDSDYWLAQYNEELSENKKLQTTIEAQAAQIAGLVLALEEITNPKSQYYPMDLVKKALSTLPDKQLEIYRAEREALNALESWRNGALDAVLESACIKLERLQALEKSNGLAV